MKAILFFTTALFAIGAYAQDSEQEHAMTAAFLAAKTMDNALVLKDYDTYVSYNHPDVINGVENGREGMIAMIQKQVHGIEESGTLVTAVWPRKPEKIIDTAGEWQCTMQQFIEYRLPEGKITAQTTIIGISPDKGKTWYFVDTADRKLEDVRTLFPNLSSQLDVPPPKEPVFSSK